MTARRVLLPFLAASLCLLAVLPASAQPRPDEYILPGENVFPEGVAFDPQTQQFYVSSTGTGAIYRGTPGEEMTDIFLPGGEDGRTFAAGLAVDAGLLFVAGGGTGMMFVYDAVTGDLVASFTTSRTPTFVNDVAVVDGSAFFTDSMSPFLYRVFEDETGWHMEEWLDFTGTAFQYVPGFNANGIVGTPDGRYLIIVQSNTGSLFRVELATQDVIEITVDAALTAGDGLVLRGRSLYVVRNQLGLIAEVRLSGDLTSGQLVGETTDESFAFPTTAAIANGRLLVVNSQFNERGGNPEEPFTVSSVRVP